MPGRACCGCCARIGCEGSGRGPPSMLGVVGRSGAYGARGWPGVPVRGAPAPGFAAAEALPDVGGCAAGGCTMRGCVTCGRFAGVSGRAGCGVCPGSSMRRRIVGGTNRPGADDGDAAGAAARGVSCAASITGSGSSTGGGGGGATSSSTGAGAATTGAGSGSGAGGGGATTGGGS